eukprot:UN13837
MFDDICNKDYNIICFKM